MSVESLLQPLVPEPIRRVVVLDPGYSGHASDVWLVETASGDRVIRRSRWTEPPSREFWRGCFDLFGIDPRRMRHFEANAALLGASGLVPAPRVLDKKEHGGREYLVVERMPGKPLKSFVGQSEALLHQFGVWLAGVHRNRCDYFGNPALTLTLPRERFHARMIRTMRGLVERDYAYDDKMKDVLADAVRAAVRLPVPAECCPIMIDLDASQFLAKDGMLSAVVDLEAIAVGPRAFDFIGLEYVLDESSAAAFRKGYTSVLGLPDLTNVRMPYRYLYRLLGVQGSVDPDEWFARPALF